MVKRRERQRSFAKTEEDLIVGRQAVLEALVHGTVNRVYAIEGRKGAIISEIAAAARQKEIPFISLSREEFERLVPNHAGHQGVAALAPPYRYHALPDLIRLAQKNEAPYLQLLGHVQEPQKLGSRLRPAGAAGGAGRSIPGPRSAKITPAVRKVAAGAAERGPVALVGNLHQAIVALKKEGFWVYGAEADGCTPYYALDYRLPLALVIGSEAKGLLRLVRENCDQTLFIPMEGGANSLNAAVAAAVIIFAAVAQRKGWQKPPSPSPKP